MKKKQSDVEEFTISVFIWEALELRDYQPAIMEQERTIRDEYMCVEPKKKNQWLRFDSIARSPNNKT